MRPCLVILNLLKWKIFLNCSWTKSRANLTTMVIRHCRPYIYVSLSSAILQSPCIKIMELKLSWKYIVQTNTNVLRVWKCILLVCLGCSSDYRRWQWTYVCDHVCVLIGWLVKPLFIVSILKWHKLVTMCQWWCVDWSNPSLINIWPLGWATISTWPLFWLTTTVWSWLGSRIS